MGAYEIKCSRWWPLEARASEPIHQLTATSGGRRVRSADWDPRDADGR